MVPHQQRLNMLLLIPKPHTTLSTLIFCLIRSQKANSYPFPPLLIQVGDSEILLDDSTRLAEKAKSAGADVRLEVEHEMFHDFQNFAPFLPKAQQAIDRIGEFVRSF